jgi:hypothetical protein
LNSVTYLTEILPTLQPTTVLLFKGEAQQQISIWALKHNSMMEYECVSQYIVPSIRLTEFLFSARTNPSAKGRSAFLPYEL